MTKKDEPMYSITVFGLLCSHLSDELAKQAYDDIELYLHRHMSKDGNGCIVLNNGKLEFGTVALEDKK